MCMMLLLICVDSDLKVSSGNNLHLKVCFFSKSVMRNVETNTIVVLKGVLVVTSMKHPFASKDDFILPLEWLFRM